MADTYSSVLRSGHTVRRMLANQHKLVDMLANTPIMRRLAQMTHYAYRRATFIGQQKMEEFVTNEQQKRQTTYSQPANGTVSGFLVRFLRNIQAEFEKANKLKPK